MLASSFGKFTPEINFEEGDMFVLGILRQLFYNKQVSNKPISSAFCNGTSDNLMKADK